MKNALFAWFISIITCLATPDWNTTTTERFIGSNDLTYASIQTVNDNQASYYSWREIKHLIEYSKKDNSIINNVLISDILYNLDANHNDPNTKPKVTQKIIALNNTIKLSQLFQKYHRPTQPLPRPEWLKRLTWKKTGLYLDDNLLILPNNNENVEAHSATDSILEVYNDRTNLILSIQSNDMPDSGNYLFCIPAHTSKIILDWAKKLPKYLLINTFDHKQQANDVALKLNKMSQDKSFYSFNPEIWSTRSKTGKTIYLLVHRPSILPLDPEDITNLERAIEHKVTLYPSDAFIEKWIPFSASNDSDEEDDDQDLSQPEQESANEPKSPPKKPLAQP